MIGQSFWMYAIKEIEDLSVIVGHYKGPAAIIPFSFLLLLLFFNNIFGGVGKMY